MRVFTNCVAVVWALASCVACAPSKPSGSATSVEASASSQAAPSQAPAVNPAKVARVRSALPTGYEVTALPARTAPLALWGYGPQWVADPAPCGVLANPAGPGVAQGFSASGPGGIIYAVVAETTVAFDPGLVPSCPSWALSAGRTSGTVTIVGAPTVEAAPTTGMAVETTTVVEGGTQTHSRSDTFVAYLGAYVAYVAVVTDPGSADASLGPDVAANLLVETVSAVRS